MLDRLISGAGAATDGADRSVRWLARGSRRGLWTTRPGSVVVAGVLLVLAGLFFVAGLEATDPLTPVELNVVDLSRAGRHGDRAYATLRGSVSVDYVVYFQDDNGNGEKDGDEPTTDSYYWLVDPTARAGVTVRTTRLPAQILTFRATGTLIERPGYLDEDGSTVDEEAADAGLTIEPAVVVDATRTRSGTGTPIDLAGALPATGTRVDLSGSRLASWVGLCSRDIDDDGVCDMDEQDRFEIVAYDPLSRHAIRVLVDDLPEFVASTVMTGRLHRDERAIDAVQHTQGYGFTDLDLEISPVYVLDEGLGPRSAPLAFVASAILLVIAGIIVIGLAGGYLVYRREGARLPEPATTLGPGERLPLRITGRLRTPTGLEHVREAPAELIRFVVTRPMPPEAPEAASIATTLIVERTGYPQGVAVGLGELVRLSSGRVMALRGPRPGLRAVAGTGPLILSFDTDAERDRVAAELRDETGLGPDGMHIQTP